MSKKKSITCQHCKRAFKGYIGRKFCSRKCYLASRPHKVGLECPRCGSTFKNYLSQEQKFCSRKCYLASLGITETGKSSKNIPITCKYCKNVFYAYPYESKKGKSYCSPKCAYADTKKVETNCDSCGTHMLVFPSRLKRNKNRAFCSPACVGEWTSQNQRGENHPMWKDGKTLGCYPREFRNKRDFIKKRDGYKCRVCGTSKPLLIHHIDENPLNNEDSNLVTVCCKCHRGSIHGRNEILFAYDGYLHWAVPAQQANGTPPPPAMFDSTPPPDSYYNES